MLFGPFYEQKRILECAGDSKVHKLSFTIINKFGCIKRLILIQNTQFDSFECVFRCLGHNMSRKISFTKTGYEKDYTRGSYQEK